MSGTPANGLGREVGGQVNADEVGPLLEEGSEVAGTCGLAALTSDGLGSG